MNLSLIICLIIGVHAHQLEACSGKNFNYQVYLKLNITIFIATKCILILTLVSSTASDKPSKCRVCTGGVPVETFLLLPAYRRSYLCVGKHDKGFEIDCNGDEYHSCGKIVCTSDRCPHGMGKGK